MVFHATTYAGKVLIFFCLLFLKPSTRTTKVIKVIAAYHAKIILVCRKVATDHNLTAPLSSDFGLEHFNEQRLAAEVSF